MKAKPQSPDIVVEGHPALRAIAKEVPKALIGTPELDLILARMKKALREEPYGVALAAPQIAVSYRIFVVRGFVLERKRRADPDADGYEDMVFINPTLTYRSAKKIVMEGEGCLSVPGMYGDILRSVRVRITASDERGKKFIKNGSGLLAEIFEHECDHLDGVLFIDRATNIHEGRE